MKIVLVMDQYDDTNNGTTVTARRLAQNLRQVGHAVTILAGGRPEEGKLCAKKHRIPFFQWLIEAQGMRFAKPDPALYYEAFKDADVVHLFMPFRFCREAERHARQMRVPCVAAFHVQPENITSSLFLEKNRAANNFLYRWFYRRFYSRFQYIHCPSHFIAGQLAAHGYRAETRVVSNGVGQAFVPRQAARPARWEGRFVILMVGRLSREKRQDILIEAAKKAGTRPVSSWFLPGAGPTRGRCGAGQKSWRTPRRWRFTARTS